MRFWPKSHPQPPAVPAPKSEAARLIITGFGRWGFSGHGKVLPYEFFPAFCSVLANQGIATHFASTPRQLAQAIRPGCVVAHIYRETSDRIDSDEILDAQRGATLVFNHPLMGPIIGRKDESHRFLTGRGILMPPVNPTSGPVFSNLNRSSADSVAIVRSAADADPSRYNTSFIDTRITFDGQEYYTTVRLMCVGREFVHAFVRACDVREGNPSVHGADTALIPELIEHLQATQVVARMPELIRLAQQLGDILGPGFYSHDLIIERTTGTIYVTETGFKFHDWTFPTRVLPIIDALPSHRWMVTPELPQKAARAYLGEWRRLAPHPVERASL